jgi:hypothetical protein
MARSLAWLVLFLQVVAVLGANWNFAFGNRDRKPAQHDLSDHGADSDSVAQVISDHDNLVTPQPGTGSRKHRTMAKMI